MQYHAISCNAMQYHEIPYNTMQYYAILCNTMQCHATLWQTLAYSGIPWHNQCIISNCWRSVPLPCGQYMAIFKSTKVGPCEDDLECLGGPSSLCFLDKENRVGMYLGSQVTQPCNFCGFSSNWILHYFPTVRPSVRHRRDIWRSVR